SQPRIRVEVSEGFTIYLENTGCLNLVSHDVLVYQTLNIKLVSRPELLLRIPNRVELLPSHHEILRSLDPERRIYLQNCLLSSTRFLLKNLIKVQSCLALERIWYLVHYTPFPKLPPWMTIRIRTLEQICRHLSPQFDCPLIC